MTIFGNVQVISMTKEQYQQKLRTSRLMGLSVAPSKELLKSTDIGDKYEKEY